MSRVLMKKVKMRVPAGNATAAPPVGPTLGQAGVNLMDFCKLFNARTAKYKEGIDLPVKLFSYSDRTFEFHVNTPVRAAPCASISCETLPLPSASDTAPLTAHRCTFDIAACYMVLDEGSGDRKGHAHAWEKKCRTDYSEATLRDRTD